jgi:hypothetical protein
MPATRFAHIGNQILGFQREENQGMEHPREVAFEQHSIIVALLDANSSEEETNEYWWLDYFSS